MYNLLCHRKGHFLITSTGRGRGKDFIMSMHISYSTITLPFSRHVLSSMGAYHLAKKSGWNKHCIKVSDFPNSMTNRMRMALTINYPAFHPAYFTRSGAKT